MKFGSLFGTLEKEVRGKEGVQGGRGVLVNIVWMHRNTGRHPNDPNHVAACEMRA